MHQTAKPHPEHSKKQRGRPRVAPQYETAAGRRRTQIRVAQRAYRLRKELTISELTQRAFELTNVIYSMNSSIQQLNNSAVDAGITKSNAKLALDLHEIVQSFTRLTESTVISASHVDSSEDGFTDTKDRRDNLTSGKALPLHTDSQTVSSNTTVSPPFMIAPLADPTSYSFHETSFARRLHRRAIELGCILSEHRHIQPELFSQLFKIPLLDFKDDEISLMLNDRLLHEPNQSLDSHFSPFRHLGGSGTHYPVKDMYGISRQGPSRFTCSLDDLQDMGDVSDNDTTSDAYRYSIEGFEGEWFDPNDVESYLEEKGVHINPDSTFAEGYITPDSSFAGSNVLMSCYGYSMSAHTYPAVFHPCASILDVVPYPVTEELLPYDLLSDINLDLAFGPRSGFEDVQINRQFQQTKTHVKIDVEILIDELLKKSMCIGSCPGFRRHDVDTAFHTATIAAC